MASKSKIGSRSRQPSPSLIIVKEEIHSDSSNTSSDSSNSSSSSSDCSTFKRAKNDLVQRYLTRKKIDSDSNPSSRFNSANNMCSTFKRAKNDLVQRYLSRKSDDSDCSRNNRSSSFIDSLRARLKQQVPDSSTSESSDSEWSPDSNESNVSVLTNSNSDENRHTSVTKLVDRKPTADLNVRKKRKISKRNIRDDYKSIVSITMSTTDSEVSSDSDECNVSVQTNSNSDENRHTSVTKLVNRKPTTDLNVRKKRKTSKRNVRDDCKQIVSITMSTTDSEVSPDGNLRGGSKKMRIETRGRPKRTIESYRIPKCKFDRALKMLNSVENRFDETPADYTSLKQTDIRQKCQRRRYDEATHNNSKLGIFRTDTLNRLLCELRACLLDENWEQMLKLIGFGCSIVIREDSVKESGTSLLTYGLLLLLMDPEMNDETLKNYLLTLGAQGENDAVEFLNHINVVPSSEVVPKSEVQDFIKQK